MISPRAFSTAVALLLIIPATGHATFPGQNGAFAITACPYYCGVSTVDQGGVDVVTAGGVFGSIGSQVIRDDSGPAWSADGQWLAFFRGERPSGNPIRVTSLWVMRADGSQARKIHEFAPGKNGTDPTWSPDGTQIAFIGGGGAPRGLTIVNVTGPPNPYVVVPTSEAYYQQHPADYIFAEHPEWSPDGDVIAIEYSRGEMTKGIGIIKPDATDVTDLTPVTTLPWARPGVGGCCNRAEHDEPSWSPDGERLVYVHGELDATINEGTARVETVKRNGSDMEVVIDYPQGNQGAAGYASQPLWSPDGAWIVWKLTGGTQAKWEGARPDGSARGDVPLVGLDVSWQPCTAACSSVYPGWQPPPLASLSIADVAIAEGDAGTRTATFTVTRTGAPWALQTPSSVSFGTTATGSAGADDYAYASGNLQFAAGETTKSIDVTIKGDTLDENDETFIVSLGSTGGATLADAQATGTIVDDDPTPSLSVSSPTVSESQGTLEFTLGLSGASGRTVTVSYATADGSAAAGSDYYSVTGSVAFAPGQTSRTVQVTIIGDTTVEPTETFLLNLTSLPGETLVGASPATATITDDDVAGPGDGQPGGNGPGGTGAGGSSPTSGNQTPAGGVEGVSGAGATPRAAFTAARAIAFPAARACASRRAFTIRLRPITGVGIRSFAVWVNGARVKTRPGSGTAPIVLRGLPRGTAIIRIRLTAADGRRVEATRRYRTCAPRRR